MAVATLDSTRDGTNPAQVDRLNTWLDPMSPPSWDIGFPWEIDEMWMYTILDTSADQDGAGSSNSSTPAGNSDVAPDWTVPGTDAYWTRLVSNFVDSHNTQPSGHGRFCVQQCI